MEAMISAAADTGIDIVKFQSFKADKLRKDWPNYEEALMYYKQHELSDADHVWLMCMCEKYGVGFSTTVFDLETVDFLASIGVEMVKISSANCNNWELIRKCLKNFDQVIISTGMHTAKEIENLKCLKFDNLLERQKITLLHCVSLYPTPLDSVNMKQMLKLKEDGWLLGLKSGFSDHTIGAEASKLAISLDADMVEKHFTLNRYLPGKDQLISGTIEEFRELVNWRDAVEFLMMGSKLKELSPEELENRRLYVGRFGGMSNA